MRTVTTVGDLRAALAPERQGGCTIGLVPTMGAFHEGHLSLMRAARSENDVVVVSLFVNPAQFGEGEDLDAYPRDFERDAELAAAVGVDVLFAPSVEEVYPGGFATTVSVGGLTGLLEGAPEHRGQAHFDGVTTVVTKLLNMAGPDVAYFGQKDAQQALVIRQLARDLDFPVRIAVCPTVREADGLALSSRNAYLDESERERAAALSRALGAAESVVAAGTREADAVLAAARAELDEAGIEPEYLELRSAHDLSPVERVNGSTLLAVAARVGRARLIDNTVLPSWRRPLMRRTMLKSKIHRATVTGSDLNYVGSITVDTDLLQAADIREHELVHVLDIDNGNRFETYTIAGAAGSGEVQVNGAAARLVHHGDRVIVVSYAEYEESELDAHEPVVVHVSGENRIVTVDDAVGELLS